MTVPASDRTSLFEAVQALASDEPLVTTGVDPSALDAHAREVLDELRTIDRIAQFHKALQEQHDGSPAPQLDDLGSAAISATWGPLTLRERIGTGTYGEVYRAWEPRLQREVALKLLQPTGRLPLADILKEAQLLARVRHHHVVVIHGADEIDGRVGIWMELLRGRTLHDIVTTSGPLSVADTTAIALDLCGALSAIHQAGVVHRDVKAQNVMREDSGRIVLMDFGTGEDAADDLVQMQGTPLYTAPEVLEGGAAADVRADIYGAGVLLYFLLTGAYPVEGRTLDDVRVAHAGGARIPIASRRAGIPPRLVDVVDRATAPNPSARFEDAAALGRAVADSVATRGAALGKGVAVSIAASVLVVALAGTGLWESARVRARTTAGEIVTTASDGARALYYESYEHGFRNEWAAALPLAKRAVAEDDTFALAHTWVAWCLRNLKAPPDEIIAEGKRALDLSPRTSEWERLWIEASYAAFTNDLDKETAALTALLKLRPDHFWAINNLSDRLKKLGREREALDLRVRRSDVRPTDGSLATVAARELLRAGETDRALEYARRVRTIIDQRGWFEGGSAAWLLPIEAVWRRGDIRGAAAALDAAKEEYAHGDRSARLELAVYLVTWNLSLGRTRAATDVADLIPDPNQRHFSRAIVAFHGNGGRSGLQREMASVVSSAANGGDSRVFYLVESGLIEQAQYELENAVGKDSGGMEVEKARIALARGDHRQALALLQRARPGANVTQAVYRFEYVADLYLRQGNRQQAIVTLQESLNFRSVPKLAFWWMRNELRLAELYHESGCASDARPLEAELARLLTAADPDFPLLVRLKALEAKALPPDTAASCGGLQSGPKR